MAAPDTMTALAFLSYMTFGGNVGSYLERLESYHESHNTKPKKERHAPFMGLDEEQYEQ